MSSVAADIGIVHALLDTPASSVFPSWESLAPSLRGQATDQIAAQQLLSLDGGAGKSRRLYYWQREGGRPGEIDYIAQVHGRIVPIELKSGAAGSMKSLHQFMFERGLKRAVRADANPPAAMELDLKITQGNAVQYRLVSVPLYAPLAVT